MKLSLKYKIFFLLLSMPLVILVIYKSIIDDLVKDDKTSYVFDSIANYNKKLSLSLTHVIATNEFYDKVVLSSLADPKILKFSLNQIIKNDPDITALYLLKNNSLEPLFSMSKSEAVSLTSARIKDYTSSIEKKSINIKTIDDRNILLSRSYSISSDVFTILTVYNSKPLIESQSKVYKTYFFSLDENKKNKSLDPTLNLLLNDKELVTKIKENNLGNAVVFHNIGKKAYFLAYQKVTEDSVFISLLSKGEALNVLADLKNKSLLFMLMTISFCGILSIVFSRKLTHALKSLVGATEEIKKGRYNINIKVKGNDEITDLTISFISMAKTIKILLTKLKKYNQELEVLVQERTSQLNETLSLQKTMTDSLGQGLIIFNPDGSLSNVYSKASSEIFETEIEGSNLIDILRVPEAEQSEVLDLCINMAEETLPYNDLVTFMPEEAYVSNKHINLEYSNIRDLSGKISSFVLVATDKTAELQALSDAQKERDYVSTVTSILREKSGFFVLVNKLKDLAIDIQLHPEKLKSRDFTRDAFRSFHTLKGQAAYYKLEMFKKAIHTLEDNFDQYIKADFDLDYKNILISNDELIEKATRFCLESKEWLGRDAWFESDETVIELSAERLDKINTLIAEESQDLFEKVNFVFKSEPMAKVFKKYDKLIRDLCKEKNYLINSIDWKGSEIEVYYEYYHEVFDSLIHIFRNIIGHGFVGRETHDGNEVMTEVSVLEGRLQIEISDNGNGIDTSLLRDKLELNGEDTSSFSDEEINQLIFKDNFSTAKVIDELSGRGVGLNAILVELTKIQGSVKVISKKGEGTRFVIVMPFITKAPLIDEDSFAA